MSSLVGVVAPKIKNTVRRIQKDFLPIRRNGRTGIGIDLPHKVLLGTHHKTGSALVGGIFRQISWEFGLNYSSVVRQEHLPEDFDIWFQHHSRFDFGRLQADYKGLHVIRDPRDVIISGCFYHQKSAEPWLHEKGDGGEPSYQEKLNSYSSLDDKIMFEMENIGFSTVQEMLNWDYDNPAFLEVQYKDLISDKDLVLFHKIFTFLGFPGKRIPEVLRIAYDKSLFSGNVEKSLHVRSGTQGQWKKYFNARHKARFLELFGDALIELGYENDHDWANS